MKEEVETSEGQIVFSKDISLAEIVDENEEKILLQFRKLVQNEKTLTCPMDDLYLLRFLRFKKMDVERAFKALTNWWTDRHRMAYCHDGLYPSVYEELYKKGFSTTLAHRDRHGRQILLWRPGKWNPKETSFLEMFKSNFCVIDTISMRQETQLKGTIFLFDLTGLSMSHVQACGPSAMKILWNLTDGFPMRIKGIHFINHPAIFQIIYKLSKAFMKEKMKKRMHFHGYDYTSLHEYLEPEILPTCYGGKLTEEECQEPNFNKLMLDREQYFQDLFNTNVYGYKNQLSS